MSYYNSYYYYSCSVSIQPSAISYQLLMLGKVISVISYQLSVISYQLLAISYQYRPLKPEARKS
ncbi:MAG: hypothetical protein F6K39_12885 [Okeania sp. SIO3B3]|nr:hypothetical protein [Okeania sp. SIO3B3]